MSRSAPRAWLIAILAGWLVTGPQAAATATGGAAPRIHVVVIEDFAFEPTRLEIRAGDSVEWVNRDIAPHTATAEDGSWDSGELTRSGSFRQDFAEAGIQAYFCAFHPQMRGEIVVTP